MTIKFESERIPCTAVNHPKCDYFGGHLPEVVAYVNRTTKGSFPRRGPDTFSFRRMQLLHLYDMGVLACVAKISRSRRQESTLHITIPVTQNPK